ncbi:MAG: MBL fold metallo-hydrolase [Gemmatimonadetes bacterium]|nr:MBL fold metallo-hydrolase [Gemmatimonadota bacterium]
MPPDHTNVYLAGEVLIDAGGRFDAKRIISTLENHPISAHALTHAHFDHYGGSLGICEALGVPVWCGAGDEETVSTGDMSLVLPNPHNLLGKLVRGMSRPGVPVGRVLREGDLVGGFTVIETPGHTPGHLAFWRGYDGVLILGDVAFNRNPLTLRSGITEPFRLATWNSALNRESARKLAALGPKIVCFGHGAHLTDGARFSEFAENLPSPVSIRGDRE